MAVATGAVALVPVLSYLSVAVRQIGFPYELEWMEGGMVEIVGRVLHGQAIYVQPSIHYVPYTYTPLYFWVAAMVARVTGLGFLPLRLTSFMASLLAFAVMGRLAWRESGRPLAGMVAAGLFAATFEVGGAWLDIGRVDSLYLLLLLVAVAVARRADDWPGGLLLGLAATAAFLTKQTAVVALVPLLAFLVGARRRAGLAALATFAAGVVGSTAVLDATSHGWYRYYVLTELLRQGSDSSVWLHFLPGDILSPVGLMLALGVAGLVAGWRTRGEATWWSFWVAVAIGFVGSSFLARLHSGGGNEVLIPAYAAIALMGGFGFDDLRRRGAGRPTLVGGLLLAVVALQVARLSDHPGHLVPDGADRQAGARFVAAVARTPGQVIVVDHPWYDTMAGKEAWAQGEAVHDVLRAGPSAARTDLIRSIDATLASPRITAVYLDAPDTDGFVGPVRRYFRLDGPVFSCYQCFFPVTDVALRPYLHYVRR